jgi:uncharacterized membrane protein YgcG
MPDSFICQGESLNILFCFFSDGYGQSTDRYGGPPSGGQQGGQRSYGGGQSMY